MLDMQCILVIVFYRAMFRLSEELAIKPQANRTGVIERISNQGERRGHTMICQNCKTSLQGDFKFCPGCGAPATAQKPFCPGCGKETQVGWQACPHCGQRLNSPSVSIPPQQNVVYEPRHGYHHGSNSGRFFGGHSGKKRRKGFLGNLFSS